MNSFPYLWMAVQLLLGLSIFIAGLFTMRHGLIQLTSKHMERAISTLVKTPIRGLFTGIAATLATQSSAAVTIISMGLVAANVMEFSDTIGIILGTNIGSTFTVGLLSLDIERFGPWVMSLGALAFLWTILTPQRQSRSRAVRAIAVSAVGFGTLFVGFAVMGHAVQPLTTSPALVRFLLTAKAHPWAGVLSGTIVTAIIGSSSASTALTLSLAKSGVLPLTAAVAVVLGNNIGTCTTAALASIGGSRPVQRVAATHVFLNVAGVLAFMLVLNPFVQLVEMITSDLGGQVAVAHILFNVVSSLIALPFARQIAQFLQWLLPETPQ